MRRDGHAVYVNGKRIGERYRTFAEARWVAERILGQFPGATVTVLQPKGSNVVITRGVVCDACESV